jgi:hypothetical protein
MFALHKH